MAGSAAAKLAYYERNKAACIARATAHNKANPERRKEISRKSAAKIRAADPEKARADERAWYMRNLEEQRARGRSKQQHRKDVDPAGVKAKSAAYRKTNPHIKCASQTRRKATKLRATPVWVDHEAVKDVYLEAAYQGMTVDHIVPLQGRNVCGLHWEGNLQLLTASQNSAKGNRLLDNAHSI